MRVAQYHTELYQSTYLTYQTPDIGHFQIKLINIHFPKEQGDLDMEVVNN